MRKKLRSKLKLSKYEIIKVNKIDISYVYNNEIIIGKTISINTHIFQVLLYYLSYKNRKFNIYTFI